MRKRKFIDGIFNYCDRWCERCQYTEVCRVCQETERSARRHELKGEDPSSWDTRLKDVSRSFEKAIRMAHRFAKAHGIDLDAIAKEAANSKPAPGFDRKEIREHPLFREGASYFDKCRKLVDALHEAFNDSRDDVVKRAEFMDIRAENDQLVRVRDAAEALGWDCSMVHVKTNRALDGLLESGPQAEDPDPEFEMGDACGSASVVLRCLTRDKAALLTVYEWDKQFQDAAIELLAMAERMTRALKELIPGCDKFVWPQKE